MTYVQPTGAPLEGAAFVDLLQQWVAGVTSLPGTMVRPRWQLEPPNIPDTGDAWAAIGITTRKRDAFPFVGTDQADTAVVQSNQEFTLLCSFYDTGDNGRADYYAEALCAGAAIPQNREPLADAGAVLVSIPTEGIAVPVLLKQRWKYRVDVAVVMRRQTAWTYPVLSTEIADIDLKTDDGIERHIVVPEGALDP